MNTAANVRLFVRPFSSWDDALESFILNRRAQGYAPVTIRDYRYHVGTFFRRHPEAWEPQHARRAILGYLAQEGIAPATFNIRRKYLCAFFSWAVGEGLYPDNPVKGIRRRKTEPRVIQHSAGTLQALLALPDLTTFFGVRDMALILLSLDTAIRPSEALSLEWEDVDLPELYVAVRASIAKTRQGRRLPISPRTGEALVRLRAARPRDWETALVFTTRDGTPLTSSAWSYRLRRDYAPKLGLDRLSAYDLRHDAALQAVRNGMSPFALKNMMGHSSIETTQLYIALSEKDVKEAHSTAGPLNALLPQKRTRAGKIAPAKGEKVKR